MLPLLRILKILNSDSSPSAIASAVCLALFIGLSPLSSPHNILILLIVLLFRVHVGTFIIASVGFSLVGFTFESAIESFGLSILQNQGLQSFWTAVYNSQIGRLSLFNYTTTMGGLLLGMIAFIPIWFLTTVLIKQYRTHLKEWAEKNKLIVILKSTRLFKLYNAASGGS